MKKFRVKVDWQYVHDLCQDRDIKYDIRIKKIIEDAIYFDKDE